MRAALARQELMNAKGQCVQCGAPLPVDIAVSICPRCELRGALEVPTEPAPPNRGTEAGPESASAMGSTANRERHTEPGVFGGRRFGDYELLDEIARGGMGVVYRARQVSLERIVAVKLMLAGPHATKDFVQRFRTEAAAAASLHHPNIVAIHEVGFAEGQHFFAMDFVEGLTLAQQVAKGPLPAREAAGYLKTIAEAIHFAHERNVLHRDLKPSNVLIDSATNQPRITDFGLAKRLESGTDLTFSGQVLGSPNYMSPEQATAKRGAVGRRSDVYSLGAILYHLLTGRAPFLGETLTDVLHQVANDDPLAPHLLTPRLPRDLETVCLKCLEKDPARRYQTAQELVDELGRFLNDEPVHARPIGPAGKAWRWCRRKPAIASLGATSAVLLLAVAIGGPIAAFRINQERLVAERSRLDAEQRDYAGDMLLASEKVREGAFNHARELLTDHLPGRDAKDLRGFEWRYLWKTVQDSEPFLKFQGLPAPSGWDWTLLYRSGPFLYNQSSNQLRAWDMTTWEPVPIVPPPQPASVRWRWDPARESAYAEDQTRHTLAVYTLPAFEAGSKVGVPGPISIVAMSQSRNTLAVGFQEDTSHRILVWDLVRDTRIGELGDFQATISALNFSRDGALLAAGSTHGAVGIWDLKALRPLAAPPSTESQLRTLEFTPDNRRLLFGTPSSLRVWDIAMAQPLPLEFAGHGYPGLGGFSPDGRYIVVSRSNSEFALLDSRTLQMTAMLRSDRNPIDRIAFSSDADLMAAGSLDQTARIWDLATHTQVGVIGGFGERICDVEFTPDGRSIVLLGGFGHVRVYRLSDVLKRGLFEKAPGQEEIIDLAISPDERRLATVCPEGTLALWDRPSRRLMCSVSFPRYTPKSYPRVAFSPDGERVFCVTGDALRVMSVESGEMSTFPINGNREMNALAFSPDGRELAFGCGSELMIHELSSNQQRRLVATDDEVFTVEYSPDGTRIAFGDRLGQLTLCKRASGMVISKVERAHPPHVCSLDFSPDGRLLATSGADSLIKLWQVKPDGLSLTNTLRGHKGYVNRLTFSPDGTRLVSPSADQTLKIWDSNRGEELATLYGHHELVATAKFTKDGRTIYSVGTDGEIHFWEAPSLAEIDVSMRTKPLQNGSARSSASTVGRR